MISAPRMTGEERSPLEPVTRKAVWVINPPLGESSGKLTFWNLSVFVSGKSKP